MNKLGILPAPIRIDKQHIYTHVVSGELFTGVTSILGMKAQDWLKFWTTKENYNYMISNWDIEKRYSQSEKEELLYKAKNAYAKKSRDAMSKGKEAHLWIEKYLEGNQQQISNDENIRNCIVSFLDFEKNRKVEWLLSEFIVASEIHKYAGTLDAYAMVDGKKTLIDFKTSKGMSGDYFLQTAAYQLALEEMGEKPDQRMILRLPKDGGNLEVLVVPSRLEFDKEVFLALRQVYRWDLSIDKFKKLKLIK